ncbi:ABC transporter substrate-binding protein [Neorhizobium sp. T7_12]|uniref:ABC transporter substrate-binding protein n=1 Tax=Neorhizobium sp. T7_12 TaxID=2093832 RepID=UPI000CF8698A|nr:ABC transporter substrate-binding protein [Neorhizobium sp. T7_12]
MKMFGKIGTILGLVLAMHMPAAAEPVNIKLSWVVPVTSWGSIIMEKKELMRNLGKTYNLEVARFRGTSEALQGLASGDLTIADISTGGFAAAYDNGVTDISIIADELQDGVNGHYSTEFIVREDSNIRSVADLKGKTIAVSALGSANDLQLRAMLHKHKISDKDMTIIEAAPATMGEMLKSGKADMVAGIRPFSAQKQQREGNRVLFTGVDGMGETDLIIWVAKKSYVEENRAALVDFMADMQRVAYWFSDPANQAEVEKIAASVTKLPVEFWKGWVFTKQDYYRNPSMMPNATALQANFNLMQQLGVTKKPIKVSDVLDPSIVEEASKRPRD